MSTQKVVFQKNTIADKKFSSFTELELECSKAVFLAHLEFILLYFKRIP